MFNNDWSDDSSFAEDDWTNDDSSAEEECQIDEILIPYQAALSEIIEQAFELQFSGLQFNDILGSEDQCKLTVPDGFHEIVSSQYSDLAPLEKARKLQSIKHALFTYLQSNDACCDLSAKELHEFVSKLVPNITYKVWGNGMEHLDIMQVFVDDQIVGYFKAGNLRQQRDNFLATFYQQMSGMMGLSPDEFAPVFIPAEPFSVRLAEVDFKMDAAQRRQVKAEEELSLIELSDGKYVEQTIDIVDHIDAECFLIGGLQEKLDDWSLDQEQPSNIEVLILFSFVFLLSGKDLKEDGIKGKGAGTLIDFEEYLEEKRNLLGVELPKLHIPFHTAFEQYQFQQADFVRLDEYLKKVDIQSAIKLFTDTQYQQSDTDLFDGSVKPDKRKDYLDKSPVFSNNCLFSDRQVGLFTENFLTLRRVVEEKAQQNKTTRLIEFIVDYDADWGNHYATVQVLTQPQAASSLAYLNYFTAQDFAEMEPYIGHFTVHDLTGSPVSRTPSPPKEFIEHPGVQALKTSSDSIFPKEPVVFIAAPAAFVNPGAASAGLFSPKSESSTNPFALNREVLVGSPP